MKQRIKLTEKQAHLVKDVMTEVDSLDANDNKTRITQLFDGYVKIIKRYIKDINGIYSKITFDPANMEWDEIRELYHTAHTISSNAHKINVRFGENLKSLKDEEYFDSFGEELSIAFEDLYDILSNKYDIVSDLADLYKNAIDHREEYDIKHKELMKKAEKYFADVDTMSIG